jgi:hypothetical protein
MLKTAFKVKRFQDVEDIKKNMTAELKDLPLGAFADCFKKIILSDATNVFE